MRIKRTIADNSKALPCTLKIMTSTGLDEYMYSSSQRKAGTDYVRQHRFVNKWGVGLLVEVTR